MNINQILAQKGITKYRLAKQSGVPHATLNDICSGKTNICKCSAETLYRIACVLDVSMETLIKDEIAEAERLRSYEYGLPEYLQHDLDAYKKGLKECSTLIDCLWGELYSSINIAEISDGLITPEHADYLRQKYLWRQFEMIDFTNCKRIISKAYSGAKGKNIAIQYEGEQYMLEFPPLVKEKLTDLSELQKRYYKKYLLSRYEKILMVAFEKLKDRTLQ